MRVGVDLGPVRFSLAVAQGGTAEVVATVDPPHPAAPAERLAGALTDLFTAAGQRVPLTEAAGVVVATPLSWGRLPAADPESPVAQAVRRGFGRGPRRLVARPIAAVAFARHRLRPGTARSRYFVHDVDDEPPTVVTVDDDGGALRLPAGEPPTTSTSDGETVLVIGSVAETGRRERIRAGLLGLPGGRAALLDGDDLEYAGCLGAALIAGGDCEPWDVYPHTVRLRAHRIRDGRLDTEPLVVAADSTVPVPTAEPVPTRDADGPVIIEVTPESPPVELEILPHGGGVPVWLRATEPLPAGFYRIALSTSDARTAGVVFERVGSGARTTYPLASINGKGWNSDEHP